MTEFDMSNKIAMVTGASSGFGAHFAKVLAARGSKVVVAARRIDRLKALVNEINECGGEALAIALDVTNKRSIAEAFDQAEAAYGVVDVLSNNAGVAEMKMALKSDEAHWDHVINTNLKGVWMVANEAARRMSSAGIGGSIVNTASIMGMRVLPGNVSYCTSKAGVIHMTKGLALEWARKNIRVNALCPGYFVTEMSENHLATPEGKAYLAASPARRGGDMGDLTAPFLLLASDAGAFVNGIALPVDGAHSLANM